MRYLVCISYDGTLFYGFQRQKSVRTVSSCIEEVLSKIFNESIKVVGCSRTDKGVHANNFYFHFDSDKEKDVNKLKYSINKMIDTDIYVKNICIVNNEFHARYNVIKKEYVYKLNVKEYNPVEKNYVLQYCKDINIDLLKESIKYIEGTHNFKSFTSGKYENYERTIDKIKIIQKDDYVYIIIKAKGFLRYMVRNIVGLLLEINEGKKKINDINKIFKSKNRNNNSKTAPSCGLYLNFVKYL